MRACLLVIEGKIITIREAAVVKPGLVTAFKYRETTADVYSCCHSFWVPPAPFCLKETVIQFTFTEAAQL